jgi:hypothetical protein
MAVIAAQHIPPCCTVCTEQPQTNNKIMAEIKLNVKDKLLYLITFVEHNISGCDHSFLVAISDEMRLPELQNIE